MIGANLVDYRSRNIPDIIDTAAAGLMQQAFYR